LRKIHSSGSAPAGASTSRTTTRFSGSGSRPCSPRGCFEARTAPAPAAISTLASRDGCPSRPWTGTYRPPHGSRSRAMARSMSWPSTPSRRAAAVVLRPDDIVAGILMPVLDILEDVGGPIADVDPRRAVGGRPHRLAARLPGPALAGEAIALGL